MRAFAEAWPDPDVIVQRFVGQLPWGQNITLLTKLKTREERLLYAARAVEHGWSRPLLTHHSELRTLEREGKAVTNFEQRLPKPQSDLARETLKDPYRFDFLSLGSEAEEREIEAALVTHITKFLLELGAGFAFVGRQVHLEVGADHVMNAWWVCPNGNEYQATVRAHTQGNRRCPTCYGGWSLENSRAFVKSLVGHLDKLNPSEWFALAMQAGVLKDKGKPFVMALTNGKFPVEELEKFVNSQPAMVAAYASGGGTGGEDLVLTPTERAEGGLKAFHKLPDSTPWSATASRSPSFDELMDIGGLRCVAQAGARRRPERTEVELDRVERLGADHRIALVDPHLAPALGLRI